MTKNRWTRLAALVVVCGGIGTAILAFGGHQQGVAGPRGSVATWDNVDPQIPSRYAGGTPITGEPANLVHATNNEYTTKEGVHLKLVAITKQFEPYSTEFRQADHAWQPSGAPFNGDNRLFQNNGQRMTGRFGPDTPARYLTFQLSNKSGSPIDTYGYVPGEASVLPNRSYPQPGIDQPIFGRDIRFDGPEHVPLVLSNPTATTYRYGVAAGEWKEVLNLAVTVPPTESGELASGSWGTLRQVGTKEFEQNQGDNGKRVMPYAMFVITPASEPRQFSYRIRQFDKSGKEIRNGWAGLGDTAPFGRYDAKTPVDHLTIETREYTYVEFSDIHYNPAPGLWNTRYWGDEGRKAIYRDEKSGMEAIGTVRTHEENGFWVVDGEFAPDGKRWRDFPTAVGEGMQWPVRSSQFPPVIVVLDLFNRVEPNKNVQIDMLESTSMTPGKGIGKLLNSRTAYDADRDYQLAGFDRPPDTKIVQARIRVPEGSWTTLGVMQKPSVALRKVDREMALAFSRGTVSCSVFRICRRASGQFDSQYLPDDKGWINIPKIVKYAPDQGSVRLVAIMNSGEQKVLDHNSVSSNGDVSYEFELTRDSDAVLANTPILLSKIRSFEVQTRKFGMDVYLPIRLPE